jgi:hypothetical protein
MIIMGVNMLKSHLTYLTLLLFVVIGCEPTPSCPKGEVLPENGNVCVKNYCLEYSCPENQHCIVLKTNAECQCNKNMIQDYDNYGNLVCKTNENNDLCKNNSACKQNFSNIKINQIHKNNKFYVDCINGDDNNDGSINRPWKTLQNVIDTKIQTKEYNQLPFSSNSYLIDKNINAPIKAGDVIILKEGYYGFININKAFNSDFITIEGENDRVYLSGIKITGASKFRLHNLNITHDNSGYKKDNVLISIRNDNYFGNVNFIVIDECRINSTNNSNQWNLDTWLEKSANGILSDGKNIMLFKNELKNINVAISVKGDNSVVINNKIKNFSEDGIRVLGNNNLIENNLIQDCYNINRNHNDGIQSFTTSEQSVKNVIIRNNKIFGHIKMNYSEIGTVGLQGIGCFDGFYENWRVENNLIIVDNWHGITFRGTKNVKIINNTVIDLNLNNANNKPSPWIMIESHKDGRLSTNSIIRNNIIPNKIVATNDTLDENNYKIDINNRFNIFVDYNNYNFHLKSSATEIIDMGNNALAPNIDLDWQTRPRGNGIDIGAYEY